MPADNEQNPPPDMTVPARAAVDRSTTPRSEATPPLLLAQHFEGTLNLHDELAYRYPSQPLLSLFQARVLSPQRATAAIASQDGAAQLMFEVDSAKMFTQVAFTLSSMLTLRFELSGLSNLDRAGWYEQMKQDQERPAILWSKLRWRSDYMIWSKRPYYTNVYAFSPHHVEAAVRLTPDVSAELMGWLGSVWAITPSGEASRPGGW